MNMKSKPTMKALRSWRHDASLQLLLLLVIAAAVCHGHLILTDTNDFYDVQDNEQMQMMNDAAIQQQQRRRRLAMRRGSSSSSSSSGSNIQAHGQKERHATTSSTHKDSKSSKAKNRKESKWDVTKNAHGNKEETKLPTMMLLATSPLSDYDTAEENDGDSEGEEKKNDYSRSEWGETNYVVYDETLPSSLSPPVPDIDTLTAENNGKPPVIVEMPYLLYDRSNRNVDDSINDRKKKRVATLHKSPNYSGEFNPVGTLGLMHYSNDSGGGGSSTVFVMNVQGLDPVCGNAVVGYDDEADPNGDRRRGGTKTVLDEMELPTAQPTSTIPTFLPTFLPTLEPTVKPTAPPTAQPTSPQTLFDPSSSLTEYKSAGCGPRGHDALANRAECPYGYRMIKEHIMGQGGGGGVIAIIDGCQYFSFRVFECLPPTASAKLRVGPKLLRRNLLSLLPDDMDSSPFSLSDPYSFDPLSTLVGYISDNCGPRGKVSLADLAQCQYGHEKVQWVPWNGNAVVKLDGCAYFSFEVYTCLPETLILSFTDEHLPILSDPMTEFLSNGMVGAQHLSSPADIAAPAGNVENQRNDITACAVVVANGSCEEPGNNGFVLGTTNDHQFVVDYQFVVGDTLHGRQLYDADELDGKVMLIHDHDGTVIGCGTIEDEPEQPADCLCGFCADCNDSTPSACNKRDSCWYNGNESAKPHSIYLKLKIANEFLTQITVYFKPIKDQQPCQATVNADGDGLFHIVKPGYCDDGDDDDNSVGSDVFIDFRGDSGPDVTIDTSCSGLLYAGMHIERSPFVIEGYCLSEDGGSCTHLDRESSQVCSTALPV